MCSSPALIVFANACRAAAVIALLVQVTAVLLLCHVCRVLTRWQGGIAVGLYFLLTLVFKVSNLQMVALALQQRCVWCSAVFFPAPFCVGSTHQLFLTAFLPLRSSHHITPGLFVMRAAA